MPWSRQGHLNCLLSSKGYIVELEQHQGFGHDFFFKTKELKIMFLCWYRTKTIY